MQWGAFKFVFLFIAVGLFLLLLWKNARFQKKFFTLYPAMKDMLPADRKLLRLRNILYVFSLLFLVIALMRPQWGIKEKTVLMRGQDIIFAVDVSYSMYARDLKPDRLTRAKNAVIRCTDTMSGSRISLIAFAYTSSVIVPLTLDYTAVKNGVSLLSPDSVEVQGTNFNNLIELSAAIFKKSDRKRFMVIVTDGEDHEGKLEEALKFARESNIIIYTVGVGGKQGERIPLGESSSSGYKTDREGNFVLTKVNPEMLRMIAEETGGQFYMSNDVTKALMDAVNDIYTVGSETTAQFSIVSYEEKFMYPAAAAFIMFFTACVISGRKKILRSILLLTVFISMNGFTFLDTGNILNDKGIRKYNGGDFQGALDDFLASKEYAPKDPKTDFNAGTALYKIGNYEDAARYFDAASQSKDKKISQDALYNRGNTFYRNGDFKGAIAAYKDVLRSDPEFVPAKKNLELALKKQQEQKQQDQQQDQDKQNNDQQQQQQDKSGDQKQQNNGQDEKKQETDKDANDQSGKQKVKPKTTLYENLLNNLKEEEAQKQKELQKKRGERSYENDLPTKDW